MDIFENISDLLNAGGGVLWIIFFALLLLWILIIEKYYFLKKIFPTKLKLKKEEWKKQDKSNDISMLIKRRIISQTHRELYKSINSIKILVNISPLLGLLGTVTGMIAIFDVISSLGTGNARLMASGISMAVIPTMAGMVSAISGIYFGSDLEKKILKNKQALEESLK